MGEERNYAVLIDADNISDKYIKIILDEISNDGIATYKRIYGDWTKSGMGSWKNVLLKYSITPIQQYGYTTGKNATDSAMIIDAMDILYSGNVEGFCLVSSDSDFTRLASRLRESGMDVVGMGEKKTPKAFAAACNRFRFLDILAKAEQDAKREDAKRQKLKDAEVLEQKPAALEAAAASASETEKTKTAPAEPAVSEKPETRGGSKREGKVTEKKSAAEQKGEEKKTGRSGKTAEKAESKAEEKVEPKTEEKSDSKAKTRTAGRARRGMIYADDEPEELAAVPEETLTQEDLDEKAEITTLDTIRQSVLTIVRENSDDDGYVFIGDIGNRLMKRYSDFDVRNYGFKKLTPFIQSLGVFEIKGVKAKDSNNKLVYVKEK